VGFVLKKLLIGFLQIFSESLQMVFLQEGDEIRELFSDVEEINQQGKFLRHEIVLKVNWFNGALDARERQFNLGMAPRSSNIKALTREYIFVKRLSSFFLKKKYI
jgi:hypothetical protein